MESTYNNSAKPTALPPETVRRQFFASSEGKRAVVFIDGSNWYHKLRLLLSTSHPLQRPPIDFDIRHFAQNLVKPNIPVEVRDYIGKVRRVKGNIKSETLYGNQQRLLRFLQHQSIVLRFGHLIPYPDKSFHEKGVDVLLAVEMIKFAIEDKYDVAYLVSSDTDLVPAVEECKTLRKEIVYVGSALHGQSLGLTMSCNRTILLRPADVLPFVPQPRSPTAM